MAGRWCSATKVSVLAFALAGISLAAGVTRADVITFDSVVEIPFVGPFTEGAFTYNTASGSLFNDAATGNPAPAMAGGDAPGGILRIVRTDGGLFTFDGADVAHFLWILRVVTFSGVLNGILQNEVNLFTTQNSLDFAGGSQGSGALSGVPINELLVELERNQFNTNQFEAVDNIRLTLINDAQVPEPTALALLGLGLAAFGWSRRKSKNA
jgi:PEP-CTERM motif